MKLVLFAIVVHLASAGLVTVGFYDVAEASDDSSNFKTIQSFDTQSSGALSLRGTLHAGARPSWLVAHPTLPIVYASHEVNNGTVWAFGTADGSLVGSWRSGGSGPVYMSIKGDYLMVAHYASGDINVHSIAPSGTLAKQTFSKNLGVISKAHSLVPDTHTRAVFACTLGTDLVHQFSLSTEGLLKPAAAAPYLQLPAGSGPRHLAVHKTLPRAYVSLENGRGRGLAICHFHRNNGTLELVKLVETTDSQNDTEQLFPAEVIISSNGRWVLMSTRDQRIGANRDSVVVFRQGLDQGKLSFDRVGVTNLRGCLYPRSMALLNEDSLLVVGCQNSNATLGMIFDVLTGDLRQGQLTQLPMSPVFVGNL